MKTLNALTAFTAATALPVSRKAWTLWSCFRLPQMKALLVAVAFFVAAPSLFAASVTFTNSSGGDWGASSNWNTGTVPGAGDYAYLNAISNKSYTVTYSTAAGSTPWGLQINNGSGYLTTLNINASNFVTTNTVSIGLGVVNVNTNGIWTLATGQLSIYQGATVYVNGGSLLASSTNTSDIVVGHAVATNTVALLKIDSGSITTTTNTSYGIRIGTFSKGLVQINGGAVKTSFLYVSDGTGGTNSKLELNGGSLQIVAGNGLSIGQSTNGQMLMTGGTLSNASTMNIKDGDMSQSGGSAQQNSLIVGAKSGVTGALKLTGGTNLTTGGAFTIGSPTNSTGNVTVDGGTLIVTNIGGNYFDIGNLGAGTLTLSNGTVFTDAVEYVGRNTNGNGRLNVYGGTNTAAGLSIAPTNSAGYADIANTGLLRLTGTTLLIGGSGGTGTLVVRDGGTLQFETNPVITRSVNGTFKVTNATIAYKGVGNANIGTLTSNITSLQAGARLRFDGSTNTNGLNTFTLGGANNFEILEMTGASSRFNATNLMVSSGAHLDVTGGTATVAATVTNFGTISVSNAQAIYSSNVVNQAAYLSGPSTNTFNGNLTVGSPGYIKAGTNNHVFAFGADYTLQSTNGAQFDMSRAQVIFAGSGNGITTGITNHSFYLTGSGASDLGANWANVWELATNFSVGTLTIAKDNRLTLSGNSTNALYVGLLDLAGWDTSPGMLTNTLQSSLNLPSMQLYYDRNLAGNSYLSGLTYDLWGGGKLQPIPEASTYVALLLMLALCAYPPCRKLIEKKRSSL